MLPDPQGGVYERQRRGRKEEREGGSEERKEEWKREGQSREGIKVWTQANKRTEMPFTV